MSTSGWIGVDFDGTLATWTNWVRWDELGEPIMPMVHRVKRWLNDGIEVRIVTARVGRGAEFPCHVTGEMITNDKMVKIVQDWCEKHVGARLPVTNEKDFKMIVLYDDRARQVEMNTGRVIGED